MSTTASPFGLRPIGTVSGRSQERFSQYPIASGYGTAIATGDVVQLVDGGTATTIEKQGATGDTSTAIDMVGVFLGCTYTDPNSGQPVWSQLWPAGTAASDAIAFVADNPDMTFAIQANASITNSGDVYGKNSVLVQTAPSTSLKVSRVALNVGTLATAAAAPIRILGYLGGPEGDEVGSAYPVLVCKFNTHQHSSTTGSS